MGNALIALDRATGREVWRVEGIPGYLGFFDPPVVVSDTVYAASGDTHVYATELRTGRVLWKTETPAANVAFAVCGERIFANHEGLSVLERKTGRLIGRMFDDSNEFLTTGFVVLKDRVFVLGNKFLYALSCR